MQCKPLCISFILFTIVVSCSQTRQQVDFSGIIPQPASVITGNGHFILGNQIGIEFTEEFEVSGNFISSYLESAGIKIKRGDGLVFVHNSTLPKEGYQLDIEPSRIVIEASSDHGAFYAVQSLRQLLPSNFEVGRVESSYQLPSIQIKDVPQFNYRGMHLDVGRHLFSVAFIKKYIDALALLKMNTFHWHLTEDQGWRIEIKAYPRLQEVAAYRKETLVGHYSDKPHKYDGVPYGGYYTQDEIKDIVAYAQDRFITIIPEIEMPGHSQAAIAAYPELGCTAEQVEVATKWGVFENIYCPKETTFKFLENVLDEVMELFPSTYIHIGGDEAPKAKWKTCEACQHLIKKEGFKDEHELQNYFITRMERYLNSKGRQIIGWDEILEGGLAPNATVMSWRGTSGAIAAAKQHHQVVMTPTSHCYFDYYQSENDDEPLAIGGFLPLEKVYSFNPIPAELTPEEAHFIWGAQGNIWTEYLPTAQEVEYMAFPRILAMSEVVWTNPKNKNYENFVNRLAHFYERLDVLNINYANHLYDLEGQMIKQNGKCYYKLRSVMDGKAIRYTMDGSPPHKASDLYQGPISITTSVNVKAQVFNNTDALGKVFEQTIRYHKGLGSTIKINKTPHQAYTGSGPEGLINGISGSDKRFGDKEWLGFSGEDIEIEIEFDKKIEINSISTRFHNGKGQWIYAPREVLVGFLIDEHLGVYEFNKVKINSSDSIIIDFKANFKRLQSSKLLLKIPNYGIIPDGNQGAGQKAWTFIDELIIE